MCMNLVQMLFSVLLVFGVYYQTRRFSASGADGLCSPSPGEAAQSYSFIFHSYDHPRPKTHAVSSARGEGLRRGSGTKARPNHEHNNYNHQ